MDVDEVRACLRALLSSTPFSYRLKTLLNDFRNMTGFELPLFGCVDPVEFLRTLSDTVKLVGDSYNPEVALVESEKSAHITSLVDRQRQKNLNKRQTPNFLLRQKRLIIQHKSRMSGNKMEDKCSIVDSFQQRNSNKNETSQQKISTFVNSLWKPKEPDPEPAFYHQKFTESVALKSDSKMMKKGENFFNVEKTSFPSQELTVTEERKIEKPLDMSDKKTDSFYSKEISDGESNLNNSNSDSVVNDGIKNKCRELIKNYPEGLWCCQMPQLFLEEFNIPLDYREFGYTSLIQMLSELPDIFRCIRPGNGDWILFDASVPPTAKEKKMRVFESASEINCEIKCNLRKLLFSCFEKESRIELNKILDLYKEKFGNSLDFQCLGFKDLESLLEAWENTFLNITKVEGRTFVVAGPNLMGQSPIRWEDAVPPITAENDIFAETFPREAVGPDESLQELDLKYHFAVGSVVEVSIAEVWSPKKFYLQLNIFKKRLNQFMDDLQKFYNAYLHKYKMPDCTIRPNQICVGLYNSDPDVPEEWHRAKVIKVINDKTVLVNLVDYGTLARVKKSQLRFLHRSFQPFPIQGLLARLSGIVPPNKETKWPLSTSKKFLELTRVAYLKAEIVDIDFKIPLLSVTLFDSLQKSEISINQKLVLEKLASIEEPVYEDPFPEVESETRLQEPTEKQEKSLTLKDSLSFEKKGEHDKPPTNGSISFEFEEIPDLEEKRTKVLQEKPNEVTQKELTQSDMFESEEIPPVSKGVSLFQQKMRSPNLRPLETPQNSCKQPKQPAQPEGVALEQTSSNLPAKPSRVPPGLEHVNILPNLNQIQFYLQPEDYKNMVNVLAMELLSTKPCIKKVGMSNPALALEIATEMAQAYVASQYSQNTFSTTVPQSPNVRSAQPFPDVPIPPVELQPNIFEEKELPVPVLPVFPHSHSVSSTTETTTPATDSKDSISLQQGESEISPSKAKRLELVEPKKIGDRDLHLVTIDNKMYFCAEEIVRNFTLISNRDVADRVLNMKKFYVNYRIITKKTDEEALTAIKSSDVPVLKKKSKKPKVYLIPITEVLPFLQALGCITRDFENEFVELMEKEKSNETTAELS